MKTLFLSFFTLCMLISYQTCATASESEKQDKTRVACSICGKVLNGFAPPEPSELPKRVSHYFKYNYHPNADHYMQHHNEETARRNKEVKAMLSSLPYRDDGNFDETRLSVGQLNYLCNTGAISKSYENKLRDTINKRLAESAEEQAKMNPAKSDDNNP